MKNILIGVIIIVAVMLGAAMAWRSYDDRTLTTVRTLRVIAPSDWWKGETRACVILEALGQMNCSVLGYDPNFDGTDIDALYKASHQMPAVFHYQHFEGSPFPHKGAVWNCRRQEASLSCDLV